MARHEPVRTALAAVLVAALVTCVGWWRLGPVTARTVWAEDGGVFLREHVDAPWDLLRPYAGYLHLVPRLLVGAAWTLPVERYALALSAGACLIVGGAAALVFVLARDVVGPWPVRALLAVVPAVLPLAPVEIAGNAANLHWFLLALAPWLLAYRARSWTGSTGVAAATVGVTLSEPLTAMFLPLLLLAWGPRPSRRPRHRVHSRRGPDLRPLPVTVVAVVGATAQVVVAATDGRPGPVTAGPRAADVFAGWLLQPFGGLLRPRVGETVRAVLDHGWWVVGVPALAVAALLVAAVVVAPAPGRWLVLALTGGSVVTWAAALWVNGVAVPWATSTAALVGVPPLRYAAASGLLLLSAVATAGGVLLGAAGAGGVRAVAGRDRSDRHAAGRNGSDRHAAGRDGKARHAAGRDGKGGAARPVSAALGCCAVALVVASAGSGTVPRVIGDEPPATRRSAGPAWAPQLPAATRACRSDPGLDVVRVRTAPWGAAVPCDRLR